MRSVTSPLFPAAQLSLPGGKKLLVRAAAEGGRPLGECRYIHAVTWNGQPWTRLWIGHAELMQGGELRFLLADQPPARRQYAPDELPFSLSTQGVVSQR